MKYALPCLIVLIVLVVGACTRATFAGTEAKVRVPAPASGTPGLSGGGGRRAELSCDILLAQACQA